MEITELINHPEKMDRNTLYELRSSLAVNPYFQTLRLLMLQNLYIMHDPTFGEELNKAAVYITDRRSIFRMVEYAHYQIKTAGRNDNVQKGTGRNGNGQNNIGNAESLSGEDRTASIIESFLEGMPFEEVSPAKKRMPTPADATVDYVSYLLASEDYSGVDDAPQMKGQTLIDNFLEQDQGHLLLQDKTANPAASEEQYTEMPASDDEEEYFTETLARIYIKQGRYQKAIDIIERLSAQHPSKNAYFADQIRFLEKLIINNNKIKK